MIDKLCSRLGNDALYTLTTVDDHRPEKAWEKTLPESQQEYASDWPDRPLWLLQQPWPVTNALSRRLSLESEAERIETGWWDNTDVRRDYYLVRDDRGTRYWAYRQRGDNSGLFIHGIFS